MTATQTAGQTRYIAKCRNGHRASFIGSMPDRYGFGSIRNCKDCGTMLKPKAVKGTYSEQARCDARCTGSESTECSCSCEGLMHGADL
jgi:hypothetical protein